jgi:hypothetical protein
MLQVAMVTVLVSVSSVTTPAPGLINAAQGFLCAGTTLFTAKDFLYRGCSDGKGSFVMRGLLAASAGILTCHYFKKAKDQSEPRFC